MTFMEKSDFDKWLKAGLRKDEIDMLFNIISWVCIILVILYVIGLIVVIIITDYDKPAMASHFHSILFDLQHIKSIL